MKWNLKGKRLQDLDRGQRDLASNRLKSMAKKNAPPTLSIVNEAKISVWQLEQCNDTKCKSFGRALKVLIRIFLNGHFPIIFWGIILCYKSSN